MIRFPFASYGGEDSESAPRSSTSEVSELYGRSKASGSSEKGNAPEGEELRSPMPADDTKHADAKAILEYLKSMIRTRSEGRKRRNPHIP